MPRTTTHETSELNEKLRDASLVHVTGLEYRNDLQDYNGEIQPDSRQLGKWDHNNGMTVVITEGGEVWLGYGVSVDSELLEKVAPKGKGAHVPCSNGEKVPMAYLLARFRDSYESFAGKYRPEPDI